MCGNNRRGFMRLGYFAKLTAVVSLLSIGSLSMSTPTRAEEAVVNEQSSSVVVETSENGSIQVETQQSSSTTVDGQVVSTNNYSQTGDADSGQPQQPISAPALVLPELDQAGPSEPTSSSNEPTGNSSGGGLVAEPTLPADRGYHPLQQNSLDSGAASLPLAIQTNSHSTPTGVPSNPASGSQSQGAFGQLGTFAAMVLPALRNLWQANLGIAGQLFGGLLALIQLLVLFITIVSSFYMNRLRRTGFQHAARSDADLFSILFAPQKVSFELVPYSGSRKGTVSTVPVASSPFIDAYKCWSGANG
jgi:hypothetical protein